MRKRRIKSTVLYGISLPLILLLALILGTSYYFYANYKDRIDFSQKNSQMLNDLNNKIMEKKEDYLRTEISEEQLNSMIKDQAVGKGIGENTLESATARIVEDTIYINGLISDGTKIVTEIGMSPDGQGIFIKELNLTDAGPFASVKETLLRSFLKVTIDGIFKQGEDAGFVAAEITGGKVIIYKDK